MNLKPQALTFNIKHLDLLRELTVTHLKTKDSNSILGALWSFLNPLLFLFIIFIMFSLHFSGSTPHYGIYVLIGFVQYTYLSNCTVASMTILKSMEQLTSQTLFPKELLVFSVVLSQTYEFIIALSITIVISLFTGISLSLAILALPLIIILQIIFVLWISLLLSWVYLLVRDIQHIYQVLLRLLMFVCPIFYPLSFIKGNYWAELIVNINPLTYLINYTRTIVIEGKMFSIESFLLLTLINIVLLFLSLMIFKRVEPRFGELL